MTSSVLQAIARGPVLLVLATVLAGCASQSAIRLRPIYEKQIGWGAARQEIHNVSVIELLGRPNEFDGQPVRIIGVASFNFGLEGTSAIYASSEDERHATNSLVTVQSLLPTLAAPPAELEKLTGKFVVIEGIFRARSLRKIPQAANAQTLCVGDCRTSGTLEDVNRVSVWEF